MLDLSLLQFLRHIHSAYSLGLGYEMLMRSINKNKMPFQFNAIFNEFDDENAVSASFCARVAFVCQMTAFFGPFYVFTSECRTVVVPSN